MKMQPRWFAVFTAVAAMGATSTGALSPGSVSPSGFSVGDMCTRLDRQLVALGAIVMHETISRYDSTRGLTRKLDEFDASVEIADGADRLAILRRNGQPYSGATHLAGAWAFGDFSTVLRTTREALGRQAGDLAAYSDGEPGVLVTGFHCPASSGLWFVKVDSRTYWLDFQVEIRISAVTGDLVGISWTSLPPASGADIRQIRRTVSFASTEVGGRTYLLPTCAEYRVVHSGNRVEWNAAQFGNAARYDALTSVRFAD